MLKLVDVNKKIAPYFEGFYPDKLSDRLDDIVIGVLELSEHAVKPAGILVGTIDDGIFAIEWIYAEEQMDRRKIYQAMISYVIERCHKVRGIDRIYCVVPDDKDTLMEVLLNNNFALLREEYHNDVCCPYCRIKDFRKYAKNKRVSFVPLQKLPKKELVSLCAKLEKSSLVHGIEIPIRAEDYYENSMAAIDSEGIKAMILLKKYQSVVEISWIYNGDRTGKSFVSLVGAVQTYLDQYLKPDTKISFGLCSERAKLLMEKMIDEYEVRDITVACLDID